MAHYCRENTITRGKVFEVDSENKLGDNDVAPRNLSNPTETATLVNTSYHFGKEAWVLNGTNGYIDVTSSIGNVASDLGGTIEVWIKPDAITNNAIIYEQSIASAPTWIRLDFGGALGRVNIQSALGGTVPYQVRSGTGDIVVGKVAQIVITKEVGANLPLIYVNGVLTTQDVVFNNDSTFWFGSAAFDTGTIGGHFGNGLPVQDFFDGDYYVAKLSNIPLTALEVTKNYEAQKHRFQ